MIEFITHKKNPYMQLAYASREVDVYYKWSTDSTLLQFHYNIESMDSIILSFYVYPYKTDECEYSIYIPLLNNLGTLCNVKKLNTNIIYDKLPTLKQLFLNNISNNLKPYLKIRRDVNSNEQICMLCFKVSNHPYPINDTCLLDNNFLKSDIANEVGEKINGLISIVNDLNEEIKHVISLCNNKKKSYKKMIFEGLGLAASLVVTGVLGDEIGDIVGDWFNVEDIDPDIISDHYDIDIDNSDLDFDEDISDIDMDESDVNLEEDMDDYDVSFDKQVDKSKISFGGAIDNSSEINRITKEIERQTKEVEYYQREIRNFTEYTSGWYSNQCNNKLSDALSKLQELNRDLNRLK